MNQELKQRLIGAVVVTALAAIFIPMLFDDPVDNRSQSVSELAIPETPVKTGEESANKLPTSVNQVLNTPNAGSETIVNTEEEAELSTNKPLPSDESLGSEPEVVTEEEFEQSVDESTNDSMDTGVADEPKKPVKTKKAIQEAESSKQKSTPKSPLEAEPDTNVITTKKQEIVKSAKSSSELSRWYLQAGTFSKKENAMSLMETLRKQGLPVTLDTTKGSGNTPLYRLKVGPALEKKRAAEMKAKLDNQKIQSILIAE
jgi:DedD protein